jgi:hypothetical protein
VTITIPLGPYVVGEKPSPVTYQYLDAFMVPINLTGYTAKFQYARRGAGIMFEDQVTASATLSDGPNGKVTYTWTGNELLLPGRHVAMFWAGNGINRFASLLIEFTVALSVDSAPAI